MSQFEDVAAFPLCWPEGWKRTPSGRRKSWAGGDWTVYTVLQGLRDELRLLGATALIISTSVPLRRDGLPLSKPPVDGDPGAAVYFSRNNRSQCIAIDRYDDVAGNLRAITLTISAMRSIERHGGAEILDRAFTGFAALPAPESWKQVLGASTPQEAESKYRELVKVHHPDAGGNADEFRRITEAVEAARSGK